jgi:cytidine deaminase
VDEAVIQRAIDAAIAVREHAWAPYSRFRVGSALITSDGCIHVGCNVENVSYGLTQCAERSAITAATAAGNRDVRVCVVVTDTEQPSTPCGACRQVLAEANIGMTVLCRTVAGAERRYLLRDLLPDAFLEL